MVNAVLGVTNTEFENIIISGDPNYLRDLINQKTIGLTSEEIDEVCNLLTKVSGDKNENV